MLTVQKLIEQRNADQATADRLNTVDRVLGYDGAFWTADKVRARRVRIHTLNISGRISTGRALASLPNP